MRRTLIFALLVFSASALLAQSDQGASASDQAAADQGAASVQAAGDQGAAAPSADQGTTAAPTAPASDQQSAPAPAADQGAASGDTGSGEAMAQVAQLSAKLEDANATIDRLQKESDELKAQAADAEKRAQDARSEADKANEAASDAIAKAQAISDAGAAQIKAAQDAADAAQARADSLAGDADRLKAQAETLQAKDSELEAKVAELQAKRESLNGRLASFGSLRIDQASYPELIRSGFADGTRRLGSWKLSGTVLSQTDGRQFFSRLTFPLVQSDKPVLYSFETRTSSKGWVGTGIHLFAEKVRKPRGYGEGTSLLVWLTRDAKVRGNDGTYLQVYRSDSDVSMERVLDAKVKERLDGWNRVDVLYESANEFLVIAINGSVRAAYRTYFGIGAGVTMSLRTLGEGVQFRNLEVRR